MIIEIVRAGQTITLEQESLDKIKSKGMYITINKIKRIDRIYYQVMACKKKLGKHMPRTALARVLLDAPAGVFVDHIDQDPLNNTMANLRLVTVSQNGANRKSQKNITGFKGVYFVRGRYTASCRKEKKTYFNGQYGTAEEAAKARDELAIRLFGEYASLNFPKS